MVWFIRTEASVEMIVESSCYYMGKYVEKMLLLCNKSKGITHSDTFKTMWMNNLDMAKIEEMLSRQ